MSVIKADKRQRRPKLHNRFFAIKARCSNPNTINFKRYGAKGIRCEWQTCGEFEADMLESFLVHEKEFGTKNTQIDRIDPSGNYNKENCRWVTLTEQSRNRRDRRLVTFQGRSQLLSDWSKELGISIFLLYNRVYNQNWPLEKAFNPEKHVNQFI